METKIEDKKYNIREEFRKIIYTLISNFFIIGFFWLFSNDLNFILFRLLVIYLIILFYIWIRMLITYIIIFFIEGKKTGKEKYKVLFFLSRFYCNSNPILRFYNLNQERHIKLKRYLNDNIENKRLRYMVYDLLMGIFYYPVTRFYYFFYRFLMKITSRTQKEVLKARIEGTVITTLILGPLVYPQGINLEYLIYFYLFILFLFFPIGNFIGRIFGLKDNLFIKAYPPISILNKYRMFLSSIIEALNYYSDIEKNRAILNKTKPLLLNSKLSSYNWLSIYIDEGMMDRRQVVWSMWYQHIYDSRFMNFVDIENNRCISYIWHHAFFANLALWEQGYLIEFFIEVAKEEGVKVNEKFLEELKQRVVVIRANQRTMIKLMWKIEIDWGVTTLEEKKKILLDENKNMYGIPENFVMAITQGIGIDLYLKILNKTNKNTKYSMKLEEEIVKFFMENSLDIFNNNFIFDSNGWRLMRGINIDMLKLTNSIYDSLIKSEIRADYVYSPSLEEIKSGKWDLMNELYQDREYMIEFKKILAMVAKELMTLCGDIRIAEYLHKALEKDLWIVINDLENEFNEENGEVF